MWLDPRIRSAGGEIFEFGSDFAWLRLRLKSGGGRYTGARAGVKDVPSLELRGHALSSTWRSSRRRSLAPRREPATILTGARAHQKDAASSSGASPVPALATAGHHRTPPNARPCWTSRRKVVDRKCRPCVRAVGVAFDLVTMPPRGCRLAPVPVRAAHLPNKLTLRCLRVRDPTESCSSVAHPAGPDCSFLTTRSSTAPSACAARAAVLSWSSRTCRPNQRSRPRLLGSSQWLANSGDR